MRRTTSPARPSSLTEAARSPDRQFFEAFPRTSRRRSDPTVVHHAARVHAVSRRSARLGGADRIVRDSCVGWDPDTYGLSVRRAPLAETLRLLGTVEPVVPRTAAR